MSVAVVAMTTETLHDYIKTKEKQKKSARQFITLSGVSDLSDSRWTGRNKNKTQLYHTFRRIQKTKELNGRNSTFFISSSGFWTSVAFTLGD